MNTFIFAATKGKKEKTLLYKIQQGSEGWRDRYYYHLWNFLH